MKSVVFDNDPCREQSGQASELRTAMILSCGPEVLFETCVATKFVDDDDDDDILA